MKKVLFLLAILSAVFCSSCGEKPTPAQVYEKVTKDQALNQDDFTVMADYLDLQMTTTLEDLKNSPDTVNVQKKVKEIEVEFPYTQIFAQTLATNINKLSDRNRELFERVRAEFMKFISQ